MVSAPGKRGPDASAVHTNAVCGTSRGPTRAGWGADPAERSTPSPHVARLSFSLQQADGCLLLYAGRNHVYRRLWGGGVPQMLAQVLRCVVACIHLAWWVFMRLSRPAVRFGWCSPCLCSPGPRGHAGAGGSTRLISIDLVHSACFLTGSPTHTSPASTLRRWRQSRRWVSPGNALDIMRSCVMLHWAPFWRWGRRRHGPRPSAPPIAEINIIASCSRRPAAPAPSVP